MAATDNRSGKDSSSNQAAQQSHLLSATCLFCIIILLTHIPGSHLGPIKSEFPKVEPRFHGLS